MTTEHSKPPKHPTYTCGEPIHIGDEVRSISNDVPGVIFSLGRTSAGLRLKGGAEIYVKYDDVRIYHGHNIKRGGPGWMTADDVRQLLQEGNQ
jgi:hypothetical protein